jgi:hypothetical protein
MLQFDQVPAARDAESQRNIVTPHLPVGAGVASAVRAVFAGRSEAIPCMSEIASSQKTLLAMTPAALSRCLQHDFALPLTVFR